MKIEDWTKSEEDKLKRFILFWQDGMKNYPQFFPQEIENEGDWQEHFDIWCSTGEPASHSEAKDKNMHYYFEDENDL